MIAEYARSLPFGLGERAYQELQLARFLGKLAVGQGVEQVRQRLTPPADVPDGDSTVDGDTSDHDTTDDNATDTSRAAHDLPIADYDDLAAARIVPLLADLAPEELAVIEAHEGATRQRRTVLARIAQLRDR
ncbi:MAG: hypothetical protein AAFY28_05185 [Actinomycetota bacterium]